MSALRKRAYVATAAALLVAAAGFALDRTSLERGNRLYRSGDLAAAVDVYQEGASSPEAPATFNLGTALLAVAPDSAERILETAARADGETAQRSWYNLGFRLLAAAEGVEDPDSATRVLVRAVEANRRALRRDPTDQDARWNLALAQRRLDALVPPGEETGRESGGDSDDEMPQNDPQLTRSEDAPAQSGPEPEDPRPSDNTGERSGPREGAREAWATQDPGPMTPDAAMQMLARVDDSAEALVRGLLWSHRPDVAWWSGQPYPGGRW